MATSGDGKRLALIGEFFTAYNEMDLDAFGALLTDDVHWEHHNRFKGDGRDPLLQSLRDIQAKLPDRRFGEITRWAVNGDVLYAEHLWSATPSVTDEAWGWTAGVPTSMECASVFAFEGGKIKEWSDYA